MLYLLRAAKAGRPTASASNGLIARKDCPCADGGGKRLSHLRVVRAQPLAANQTWAVDFIHDSLFNGRQFRAFAVLDEWSRENLAIEVDLLLTGERITRVLERLRGERSRTPPRETLNGMRDCTLRIPARFI